MYIVKVRKSYGDTYAVYKCSERIRNMFGKLNRVPLYLCGVYICVGKHYEYMIDD